MYITYHLQIEKPSDVTNTIPHEVLNKEIQDFLKERNCIQKHYYFFDNGFYFFIYLENGNRVDVELK